MSRGLRIGLMISTIFAAATALPGPAGAGEFVVPAREAEPSLEVEAAASLVATRNFGGWGVGLRGGWSPLKFFRFGFGVETARLHAEGLFEAPGIFPGQRMYSQTFQSTFVAMFVRAQLPLHFITTYAEVAGGVVVVQRGEMLNAQCYYGSGPGVALAVGADAHFVPSFAVGLRAGVRNPGWGGACGAVAGEWDYQNDGSMTFLSVTTAYRW